QRATQKAIETMTDPNRSPTVVPGLDDANHPENRQLNQMNRKYESTNVAIGTWEGKSNKEGWGMATFLVTELLKQIAQELAEYFATKKLDHVANFLINRGWRVVDNKVFLKGVELTGKDLERALQAEARVYKAGKCAATASRNSRYTINMTGAPGSKTNAAGFVRNADWF